ncbi:MAG: Elongation of fatty acids protein 2 [Watsoniomyces obsoletus]|nr:MAG: Elongation of fatty acids protein 2 [Watsoniomyces obsoletus]
MSTTIVLGAQWGDEGKGKLMDILSAQANLSARCAGGNNAGHTIVVDGTKYHFHLLPLGLMNPSCMNLLGSGVVVHVPSFFHELEQLHRQGINTEGRIVISDRAHIALDLHQLVDGLEEVELGKANIGTTKKGIGPAYSSKASRSGVRMGDIFDEEVFERRLRALAEGYRKRFGDLLKGYDVEGELQRFKTFRSQLREYVVDAMPLMASAQTSNANILVEGANAIMLDLDYGTYPFVTSSSTGIGGAFTGLGLNPFKIKEIVGVVKAYTTRVGSGPLPTEQLNDIGEKLQEVGKEFGVTTGRRRRCGWLDLVVVKYSTAMNYYTSSGGSEDFCAGRLADEQDSINLTKIDVLDSFPELKIATEYLVDGHALESFPANLAVLEKVEIKYATLPGWQTSTTGMTNYYDLPVNARKYVEFIEEAVGVKIKSIGTGPGRGDIILRS